MTRFQLGLSLAAAALGGWACGGSGMKVVPLDPPSSGGDQSADPALAILPGSGDLVLGWIEGDGKTWSLHISRSADAGARWSSPVRVAGGASDREEVHPHGESSPRLVVAPNERMALVWPNSITVPGRKWPAAMMRFSRSHDGGRSWSRPMTLNDDTTGALVSHQFHGATWMGDSGIAVAWLDERHVAAPIAGGADGHAQHPIEPDATIYVTTSQDFGSNWSPNRAGWQAACPCCRVSLARDPQGPAVSAWRKHFPGNVRDVVTSPLSENPAEARRVYPDDWSYSGCPHSGPAIAIGGDGASHVVWYNGRAGDAGIYYAGSRSGADFSGRVGLVKGPKVSTAHPTVAALESGGAVAAYDVTEDGSRQIRVARISQEGKVVDQVSIPASADGKYPQLAVLSDTTVVVAWTESTGERSQLRLARLHWR